MGNVDSLPVVSQTKSLVQVIAGDADGARKTQKTFSKQCPVISQARSLVEATYDTKAAQRTQNEFLNRTLLPLVENAPVAGHVTGCVHYLKGDSEKGNVCMKGASRTTAMVAGAVATGGASLATAGAVGVAAGVAYDGIVTGIESGVKGKFTPYGSVDAFDRALRTRMAGDVFSALIGPIVDAAGDERFAAKSEAATDVAVKAAVEVAAGNMVDRHATAGKVAAVHMAAGKSATGRMAPDLEQAAAGDLAPREVAASDEAARQVETGEVGGGAVAAGDMAGWGVTDSEGWADWEVADWTDWSEWEVVDRTVEIGEPQPNGLLVANNAVVPAAVRELMEVPAGDPDHMGLRDLTKTT